MPMRCSVRDAASKQAAFAAATRERLDRSPTLLACEVLIEQTRNNIAYESDASLYDTDAHSDVAQW